MLRLLPAAAVLAVLLAAEARADGFLAGYEDLPLAPGLTEVAGGGVAFDSPAGRIVEAYAKGTVKPSEVLAFYAGTLPQLGWTREGDAVYRREAEVLRLEAQPEGRGTAVRFQISPE